MFSINDIIAGGMSNLSCHSPGIARIYDTTTHCNFLDDPSENTNRTTRKAKDA